MTPGPRSVSQLSELLVLLTYFNHFPSSKERGGFGAGGSDSTDDRTEVGTLFLLIDDNRELNAWRFRQQNSFPSTFLLDHYVSLGLGTIVRTGSVHSNSDEERAVWTSAE